MSDTSTSAGVKSIAIHTSVNIFEASKSDKPQYFVDVVKDKGRTKNNNLEFLIEILSCVESVGPTHKNALVL